MPLTATSVVAAITVTAAERWLFAALASVSVWVATRVCPPSAADVAFQLNVRVAVAPTASPVTVCVPIATPAVASVKTTSKLVLTFSPPTFWTVTPIAAVVPWVTVAGAVTPVTATSVDGGGFTVIAIATLLFVELLSASFCVAIRMCPLVATPAVFQLTVRVALAPTASPAIVCVPTVTPPAVPSVSTTSKLVLTSCPPTFCTVTTTRAVSPCVTRAGAVMPVKARSVGCGFTVTTAERVLLAALSSVRLWVATRVCAPSAADVVFQLKVSVESAPTESPATVCVPSVTPAVASVRTILKLLLTFTPPTFWTVTPIVAAFPWITAAGAFTPVTATSVDGGFTVTTAERWLLAALTSVRLWVATSV